MKLEVKTITPELAKKYLSLNKDNRKISEPTVRYYASQMTRGQWILTHQGIAINKNGTKLLDGQHRLLAVVKCGLPIEMTVFTEVNDSVFKHLDTGKNRNASDVLSTLGVKNSASIAASIKKSILLGSRRVDNARGYADILITNEDIYNEYVSNSEYYQELDKYCSKLYSKFKLITKTDYSSLITHLEKNKNHDIKVIRNFFNQLVGFTPIKNNTITVLRDKLITNAATIKKLDPVTKLIFITKTWNCFIDNDELQLLRWVKDRDSVIYFK